MKHDYSVLADVIKYNPFTGEFFWKVSPNRSIPAGTKAGRLESQGYLEIRYKGKFYLGHRLAFYLSKGFTPRVIDHINGNPSDNRWCNLREASRGQNSQNTKTRCDNTSGIKGVTKLKNGRWRARVKKDGVTYNLGDFVTKGGAAFAVKRKRQKLHGEFTNHG